MEIMEIGQDVMEARRYDPDKDFESVKAWGKQWGANYSKDLLPSSGYIVPGIAAYFIYYTATKVVWLENLVSNKEVPASLREKALEKVTTAVLKEVNASDAKIAYATTDNIKVINRALKHGATGEVSQTLLTITFK